MSTREGTTNHKLPLQPSNHMPLTMPLIQPPGVDDRDVHKVESLEDNPKRFNGSLQCGRVGQIKGEALLLEKLRAGPGFSNSPLGQRDVDPTREEVLLVPRRFAVTNQDQGVLHVHVAPFGSSAGCRVRGAISTCMQNGTR